MMPVLFHLCWEFRDLLWSGRRNDLAHVREMRIPEIRSSLLALRKKGPSSHSALILPIAHWGPFIFPFWISFQLFPFSPFPVFLLYLSLKKYSFQKSKTKEKKKPFNSHTVSPAFSSSVQTLKEHCTFMLGFEFLTTSGHWTPGCTAMHPHNDCKPHCQFDSGPSSLESFQPLSHFSGHLQSSLCGFSSNLFLCSSPCEAWTSLIFSSCSAWSAGWYHSVPWLYSFIMVIS
jgi:hypothetical protein